MEDALADLGYEVGSEVTYVVERDEVAANRSLTTTIALLGFVIVATSMVGSWRRMRRSSAPKYRYRKRVPRYSSRAGPPALS